MENVQVPTCENIEHFKFALQQYRQEAEKHFVASFGTTGPQLEMALDSQLLQVAAAIRFLSIEPLLGPIDLRGYFSDAERKFPVTYAHGGIDWVIAGGESGPHARPMHPDWARQLRDQCEAANVPFFFKQWGEWLSLDHQSHADPTEQQCFITRDGMQHTTITGVEVQMSRVGKKAAGRRLDGREHSAFPEVRA